MTHRATRITNNIIRRITIIDDENEIRVFGPNGASDILQYILQAKSLLSQDDYFIMVSFFDIIYIFQ